MSVDVGRIVTFILQCLAWRGGSKRFAIRLTEADICSYIVRRICSFSAIRKQRFFSPNDWWVYDVVMYPVDLNAQF